MKFNPSFWIVVLVVLVNIQTAIGRHDISLEHMFPASWIDSIVAWHVFLAYIGTAIIGAIAAPSAFRKAGAAAAALIVAFVLMFSPGVARAADNLPAIAFPNLPIKASTFVPAGCTPTSCSGLYVGLGLTGNGTNADILGSGLSQSVFAAGAAVDVHVGYQLWNGSALFGVEAGLRNEFQSGPIQINGNTFVGYEGIKLGGTLSGLLGQSTATTGTTVAGQTAGPLPVFTSLANAEIAPYGWIGMVQRNGYNQGTYGGGIEYALAQSWNLDARYDYGPAIGNLKALQEVTTGLNYHFSAK